MKEQKKQQNGRKDPKNMKEALECDQRSGQPDPKENNPTAKPEVSVKITSLKDGKVGFTPYVRNSGPPFNLQNEGAPLVLRFQTVLLNSLVEEFGADTVANFKSLSFYYDGPYNGPPSLPPGTGLLDPGHYIVQPDDPPSYGLVTMKRDGTEVYKVAASNGSSNWVSIEDVENIPFSKPSQQYHFTLEVEVTKGDGSTVTYGSDPVMINKDGVGPGPPPGGAPA